MKHSVVCKVLGVLMGGILAVPCYGALGSTDWTTVKNVMPFSSSSSDVVRAGTIEVRFDTALNWNFASPECDETAVVVRAEDKYLAAVLMQAIVTRQQVRLFGDYVDMVSGTSICYLHRVNTRLAP